MEPLAIADHPLPRVPFFPHHPAGAGAIPQCHLALKHVQIVGRAVLTPLEAQQVARLPGPGAGRFTLAMLPEGPDPGRDP